MPPANTPPQILTKLADSLEKTLKDPEVVKELNRLKIQGSHMDQFVFQRFTKDEVVTKRRLLEAADLIAK